MTIGSGASSAFWCRMLAHTTGKRICIPQTTEASALGAAITAAKGAGWQRTIVGAAGAMTGRERTFEPDCTGRPFFLKQSGVYKRIYPQINTG